MATIATSSLVFAQGAPMVTPPIFDPTLRSGEPPSPLKKEFTPPSMPPPSPVLPPVPPTPSEDGAQQQLGQIQVFVKTIVVTGIPCSPMRRSPPSPTPYENRTLTTEDLERLRLALTLLYVNNGYITSGAVIPDQDVKDGVIQLPDRRGGPVTNRRRRNQLVSAGVSQ